jgi:uncharacterized protein YeaO (DUF488 family)
MGESACFARLLDDEGRMPDPPGVQIRRVYEAGPPSHGEIRVLVDRVWPRGVRKDSLFLHSWAKDVAPSAELRRWFAHDPRNWAEFQRRYRKELLARTRELEALVLLARGNRLVLLYGARDQEHNQAAVLKEVLEGALVRNPR